jgi:Ca2+-binding RTX toxin-like protein
LLFAEKGSSGVFFLGSGHVFLDSNSAADTVVAGAGSSPAALLAEHGASLELFSPIAHNVLTAGSGNDTLSAASASGGNVFVAGTGADSLIGGSGPDVFTFVFGHAGGADTVGHWDSRDKLALVGYAAHGGYAETTENGNATVTLHDGTTITFENVSDIPASQIVLI